MSFNFVNGTLNFTSFTGTIEPKASWQGAVTVSATMLAHRTGNQKQSPYPAGRTSTVTAGVVIDHHDFPPIVAAASRECSRLCRVESSSNVSCLDSLATHAIGHQRVLGSGRFREV